MPTKEEIEGLKRKRFNFLHHLYDKSNGNELMDLNMWNLGDELGFTHDETDKIDDYLDAEGLVKHYSMGGSISITHEGIVQVENALAEPEMPTPYFPSVNIINVEKMIGGQIQQGTSKSSQTSRHSKTISKSSEKTKTLMQSKPSPLEKGSWVATILSTILVVLSYIFSGVRTVFGFFLTSGLILITVSLIPWNLLFHTKIFRKQKLLIGIQRTRIIGCILGILCLAFSAYLFKNDLYSIYLLPPTPTTTPTIKLTSTISPTPSPTHTTSPTPTFQGQLVINLVASFYTCINNARATPDYETCWNLLSDHKGEFQTNIVGGYQGFIDFWSQWKVSVDLFYCKINLVTARFQLYDRTDISKPSNPNQYGIVEYTLAFDDSGWRIKSGSVVTSLRSSCGNSPVVTISTSP